MSRAMDDVRLDDLRLVAALAGASSLADAARALGAPKQTVSRRLALLEGALGAALVARGGHRLRLTEEGAALAERAREVLRLAEEALRSTRDRSATPTGTLRLTTTAVIAEWWLSDAVADYLRAYPEVGVELFLTERQVDLTEEGFDAAIRIGALATATGSAARLAPAELALVASPAYLAARGAPATPEDLPRHECLLHPLGAGEVAWPFGEPWGRVPVRGRLRVNHAGVVRAAALAGLGIAMLPEVVVRDDLAAGRLARVLEACAPTGGNIWLLSPSPTVPARVAAFVALIRERFRSGPPAGTAGPARPTPADR